MSTSNNAPTIAHILSHLDANPSKILTKDAQNEYLKTLTSTHYCPYTSSTFGHTFHNETSLRKALTSIMASYIRPGVDVRPGKSAVDELFERGSEMLDEGYVEGVREAAKGKVLKRRVVEESEDSCSDEEHREDWAVRVWEEQSSGSDEDWEPVSKKTKAARKRGILSSRKDEVLQPLPAPPDAPKKNIRQKVRYNGSMDRPESPLALKRPAPAVDHYPSTSCAPEGSECDHADDESCHKRVRIWRKSVKGAHRAEAMLRKLSTVLEQNKIPEAHCPGATCEARKTPVTKVDTRPPSALPSQIAELNELIRSAAEQYVSGIPPTQSADVVTRPAPELGALYAQVFHASDWKSEAVTLQSRSRLPTIDLLRSLIAAFLFTRIFTKTEDLPWLTPETLLMLKVIAETLTAFIPVGDREKAFDATAARLLHDESLDATVLKPNARKLASDCLLILNGHLSLLRSMGDQYEVESMLRQDIELVCEKALRIQSRFSLSMASHWWMWPTSGPEVGHDSMQIGAMDDRGEAIAFVLFPGVEWKDGKAGGSVPAVSFSSGSSA